MVRDIGGRVVGQKVSFVRIIELVGKMTLRSGLPVGKYSIEVRPVVLEMFG